MTPDEKNHLNHLLSAAIVALAKTEATDLRNRAINITENKTFGKHDFTGYSQETLEDTLRFIGESDYLPGPVRVLKTAIEGALTLVKFQTLQSDKTPVRPLTGENVQSANTTRAAEKLRSLIKTSTTKEQNK